MTTKKNLDKELAIKGGRKYYTGKVCQKHPDLLGKRYIRSGNCPKCLLWRTRKHKSGINEDLYNRLMKHQDGRCACCHRKFSDDIIPQGDHCHEAGVPRGLLCVSCNFVEGHLRMLGKNAGKNPHEIAWAIIFYRAFSPFDVMSGNVVPSLRAALDIQDSIYGINQVTKH